MQELKVTEANALLAHSKAGKEAKQVLENLFGTDIFNRPITERVKTFEDALEIVGCSSENLRTLLSYNGVDTELLVAQVYAKLRIIAKALNESWTPDWSNNNQKKYFAWFEFRGSGVGFAYLDCVFGCADACVGSRLCFKNSELATYFGKQFIDLHKIILEQ